MEISCNAVDKNRYINDAWASLKKKCGHYQGNDTSGRGLCDHNKNSSDVEQERGCVRCGLPWCAFKGAVDKMVKRTIARNILAAKKTLIPRMYNADPSPKDKEAAKVIDITTFVSPDAVSYARECARV